MQVQVLLFYICDYFFQAWMNNFEDDLELQMCGGCGRRFERRAALNSHSQICQKRIAIQNNKTQRPFPSNSTSTTSNRVTSAKVSLPSTDWQNIPQAEHTKQDADNRLTPLSVQSENSGLKCIITPSPSPVPHDQFLSTSPSSSFHRTRHCSGSSVVKKEVPEKRIEIQIRRDYCKIGTSSSSVSSVSVGGGSLSHNLDSSSELYENPFSNVDAGHDDEMSNFIEDSKQYESRELCTSALKGDIDNPVLGVCMYPDRSTEMEESQVIDCDNEDIDCDDMSSIRSVPDNERISNHSDKNINSCIGSPTSEKIKSEFPDDASSKEDQTSSRRTSSNSEDIDAVPSIMHDPEILTIPNTNTKKEELFSPIMESRMQSMINIRRLQCLPCQKKFNKLTNLRRHVAVHIGWNRYRCVECPFKCFSKYDCVAHINKIHLEKPNREKAQSMVEYIESQVCDITPGKTKEKINTSPEIEDGNEVSELNFRYTRKKDQNFPENITKWSAAESVKNEIIDSINNEENCKPKSELESETDKEEHEKEPELDCFTVNSELSDTVKSDKNKTEIQDTTTVELRMKSGRRRPRKRLASSDDIERQSETLLPKKMSTVEFKHSRDMSSVGKK